jgi:hypothetical protein
MFARLLTVAMFLNLESIKRTLLKDRIGDTQSD